MKRAIFWAGLWLLAAALAQAQSNTFNKLIENGQLIQNQQYQQALDSYQQILRDPALPQWLRHEVYAGLACACFGAGQPETGLAAFSKAVTAGFNNFIAVHQLAVLKPLFNNPKFREAYASMRISEADQRELYWLYSEIQSVSHDTRMMITENTNRPDDDWTTVPQSAIPARQPQSPTILVMREMLRTVQAMQRNMVRQSDQSRMNHNMQMGVIANYPSGGRPSGSYPGVDPQEKVRESRRQAGLRAQARQLEVAKRQFLLPPGVSTSLQPCPALGSIDVP